MKTGTIILLTQLKKKMTEKTHWLQSANKNFLGHPDLPSGKDVILTIESAKIEEIENPTVIINKKPIQELKTIIRFAEKFKWLKPFICNQTNSQTIIKITGEKYMEDCVGKRIKIGVSEIKMYSKESGSMETRDCLRVRNIKEELLICRKIGAEQVRIIQDLLDKTDKSAADICGAHQVEALKDLLEIKFNGIIKRLKEIAGKNGNN